MCRVLGVVADGPVLSQAMFALYMQIYAGEESTGIASLRAEGIVVKKSKGRAVDVFPQYESSLETQLAIGHNGCVDSEIQPIIVTQSGHEIAFVADASRETTAKIEQQIQGSSNILVAVRNILLKTDDPFSLVILSPEDGLIAARNMGIRPLTIGQIEIDGTKGFYVASQSGVMIDGTFLEAIEPGNMVIVNHSSYRTIAVLPNPNRCHCINEATFRQRPGNICGTREVNQIRIDIGRALGERFKKVVEVQEPKLFKATPILEGGRSFALGFSQTSGIPTDVAGSIRSIYSVPPRMKQAARQVGLFENFALGLIPNVRGLTVVLLDDQVRSGRKVRHMADKCLRYGAKEVMVVVGSVGRNNCPFGDVIYKGKSLVGKNRTDQEIAKELGVSKFISLGADELIGAIDTPRRIYCTECIRNHPPS